jgi:hypothetical protein
MGEQAQTAARAMAAGRILVGVALCAAPDLVAWWAGDDVRGPGGRVVVRAAGGRDVALGLGTLASSGDAEQLRRWLVASSVADAVDFATTLAGPRTPGRNAVLAMAAAAAAGGLALAAAA